MYILVDIKSTGGGGGGGVGKMTEDSRGGHLICKRSLSKNNGLFKCEGFQLYSFAKSEKRINRYLYPYKKFLENNQPQRERHSSTLEREFTITNIHPNV